MEIGANLLPRGVELAVIPIPPELVEAGEAGAHYQHV
jgi:hypothetical protein